MNKIAMKNVLTVVIVKPKLTKSNKPNKISAAIAM